MNVEIPAPSAADCGTPPGYDIPRDTISREFLKSAKTARQMSAQSSSSEGLRQYLIPSTSSTKLCSELPRITVSSLDEDIPRPDEGTRTSPSPGKADHFNDGIEQVSSRTHNRSLLSAFVVAGIVLCIVIVLIVFLLCR
ncbi:hypothetical protein Q1695_014462 [Nippostrongylus brasiliensis]|nr:hypothetical protein Q1695_014462 [Nippostrongylus brasiliensis]